VPEDIFVLPPHTYVTSGLEEFSSLPDIFYIPSLEMYIPSLEMYIPSLEMYIPSFGIYIPRLGI